MIRIEQVIRQIKERVDMSVVNTVLDLGCGSFATRGDGFPEHDILYTIFDGCEITGIDIFEPDIIWRKENGPKGEYLCMDILDFDLKEDYDVIICHHTLEHLSQEDHDTIFDRIEKTNYKYSILGGPIGESNNDTYIGLTKNVHQKHLIGLNPLTYENYGYDVYILKEQICDDAFLAIKEK